MLAQIVVAQLCIEQRKRVRYYSFAAGSEALLQQLAAAHGHSSRISRRMLQPKLNEDLPALVRREEDFERKTNDLLKVRPCTSDVRVFLFSPSCT